MINVLTYDQASTEITPTKSTGHALTLEDGTQLFYRAWIPSEPAQRALVIFHRGHEHSGRLEDVVRDLHLRDIAVFAWDARGHGHSEGPRGYAPSFSCTARDTDEFIRHVSHTHGIQVEDMVVLGHSVGAVTVAEHWPVTSGRLVTLATGGRLSCTITVRVTCTAALPTVSLTL